jgi:hypothetical protein
MATVTAIQLAKGSGVPVPRRAPLSMAVYPFRSRLESFGCGRAGGSAMRSSSKRDAKADSVTPGGLRKNPPAKFGACGCAYFLGVSGSGLLISFNIGSSEVGTRIAQPPTTNEAKPKATRSNFIYAKPVFRFGVSD